MRLDVRNQWLREATNPEYVWGISGKRYEKKLWTWQDQNSVYSYMQSYKLRIKDHKY